MQLNRLSAAWFAWRFMEPLPLLWRLHQVGRTLLFPADRVLQQLPSRRAGGHRGVLLDLGCGHGVLLGLAQRQRPDLEFIGIDLSPEKIRWARVAFDAAPESVRLSVRELAVIDIADFPVRSVDVITIVDVLYLVPVAQWPSIFGRCYDCLRPGGRLLLKEMNPAIRWKHRLLQLEETLAVRLLRLTQSRSSAFTFPPAAVVDEMLRTAGFTVSGHAVDRGYTAPHYLWIGDKPLG